VQCCCQAYKFLTVMCWVSPDGLAAVIDALKVRACPPVLRAATFVLHLSDILVYAVCSQELSNQGMTRKSRSYFRTLLEKLVSENVDKRAIEVKVRVMVMLFAAAMPCLLLI